MEPYALMAGLLPFVMAITDCDQARSPQVKYLSIQFDEEPIEIRIVKLNLLKRKPYSLSRFDGTPKSPEFTWEREDPIQKK
ncbi:hypothetical protein Tco_1491630 [Tanacetum coccineum]